MKLGAVADDLTGGTDLALTLWREGFSVIQPVGPPLKPEDLGDADAVVVSLKSRTLPAAQAVNQALDAARLLIEAGAQQIFFKYCSTFDSTDEGNIGPVTDALMTFLGVTRAIACPAFPANGRTVYRGHLFVGDQLLSESPMKDHPLTPMRDANLVRVLGRQTSRPIGLISHDRVRRGAGAVRDAFDELEGIAIVDATSEADLRAIGSAMKGARLVTGGSGAAMGLPDNFLTSGSTRPARPSRFEAPAGRGVILAGSCSAATRRQIETAIAAGLPALRIDPLDLADGAMTAGRAADCVRAMAGDRPVLVYSSAEPDSVRVAHMRLGREEAGSLVEGFMGDLAARLAQTGVSRFIVTGGETSGSVVAALEVSALEIGPEIAPGVPWMRSRDPDFTLALKSGNFGDEQFLLRAWRILE